MHARIVYFEGCPNAEPAASMVREVAAELGINITAEMARVTSPEEARRERMHGSPTIQIDGVDVDPAKRDDRNYSFGCRVFGGSHGLPPKDMLAAALQKSVEA